MTGNKVSVPLIVHIDMSTWYRLQYLVEQGFRNIPTT